MERACGEEDWSIELMLTIFKSIGLV